MTAMFKGSKVQYCLNSSFESTIGEGTKIHRLQKYPSYFQSEPS